MGQARVGRRLAGMTAFTEVQFEDAFAHASAVVMPLSLQVRTAVETEAVGTRIRMTNPLHPPGLSRREA